MNYRLQFSDLRAVVYDFAVSGNERLIRSARRNGHDPYVYLKDLFIRLPIHRADNIAELLAHH